MCNNVDKMSICSDRRDKRETPLLNERRKLPFRHLDLLYVFTA